LEVKQTRDEGRREAEAETRADVSYNDPWSRESADEVVLEEPKEEEASDQ
jgi:hypothetical protein